MAAYAILSSGPPYYEVRVSFADRAFDQNLVSNQVGGGLDAQLQAYADVYESDWLALTAAAQPDL